MEAFGTFFIVVIPIILWQTIVAIYKEALLPLLKWIWNMAGICSDYLNKITFIK